MRGAAREPAVPLALLIVCASSCTLPDFLSGRSTAPGTPPTVAAASSDLTVNALPVYRLIADPALADLPSRLLVLQVRLSASGGAALSVAPDDVALTLPNGAPARVFDRARAVELLRRTMLADANRSYLQRTGNHPPGGLDAFARARLSDLVTNNLLTNGAVAGDQTIEEFVVVDTGTPLASLDGAALHVVAYRLRDAAPQAATYQFAATAAAASEAP